MRNPLKDGSRRNWVVWMLAAALIIVSVPSNSLAMASAGYRATHPEDGRSPEPLKSGLSNDLHSLGIPPERVASICGYRDLHPPIHIENDAQFGLPGSGVTRGDGTPENPYIIEGWCIIGPGRTIPSEGISISRTSEHFVVRDNLVRGFFLGMTFTFLSNGAVEDNVLRDNHQALSLWGAGDVPVSRNWIFNSTYGLFIREDSRQNSVSNNTFDAPLFSVGSAISVEGNDNTIRDNVITGNEYGIAIGGSAEDNRVRGNNIEETDVGVRGEGADTVDAENNWWACPDGPDDPDCVDVKGDVDYDPWLTSPNPEAGAS